MHWHDNHHQPFVNEIMIVLAMTILVYDHMEQITAASGEKLNSVVSGVETYFEARILMDGIFARNNTHVFIDD